MVAILCLLGSFYVGGKSAFANTETVLKSQYFDGSILYYTYQLSNGKEYIQTFRVDERIKQKARGSKNPIQVVKSELVAAYSILEQPDNLGLVQGKRLKEAPGAEVKIDSSLKETFQSELKEANRYTKEQMKTFSSLSKEEQKTYYDTNNPLYQSYEKSQKSIPEDKAFNDAQKQKEKQEKEEKVSSSNWLPITLGIVFVIGLLSFVYYAMKRGR